MIYYNIEFYPYSRAQTPDKESSSTHTSDEKVESESPKVPAGPAGYVSCNIAVNINFDHYYRINPKSYLAFFNFSLTA